MQSEIDRLLENGGMNVEYINVRAGKLPGKIQNLVLNGGRKVANALEVAGLNPSGYEIRVGTVPATVETDLKEGDTVLLLKKVKGNGDGYITVRVGKLPGKIVSIALNGGRTVRHALEGAELDPSGYEIRVGTVPANLETELKEGDTVLLLKKVKGNNDFVSFHVEDKGFILVRVGHLPGKVEDIALDGGRTVADALAAAGLDSAGFEVLANGSPVNGLEKAWELHEGDTVLLHKKSDKGFIEVKVGRLPGQVETIGLNGGRTVYHALHGAELFGVEGDIQVNGEVADLDTPLKEGDTVLLVKPRTIEVWVGRLQETTMKEGSTVADVLEAAGMEDEEYGQILIDREPADEETEVTEGCEVIVM
jgi:sulfur carrier protein ThiS